MKQYKEVFVIKPTSEGSAKSPRLSNGQPLDLKQNVVVLTLEELKDVWESASTMPDLPGVLELYLKSKGIEL